MHDVGQEFRTHTKQFYEKQLRNSDDYKEKSF